jgi:putative GTP pyrophosphokinase
MDFAAIKLEFGARDHIYKQLRDEALFILEPAISKRNIKLHSITHRLKGVDSFIDKIQRKESEKPFDDIKDIVGIRVICLFLSDIERVGDVIRESFLILDEDNKVEGAEVSSFGYMSVHFTVTMKKEHAGPRYDPIANLPLEIQVRTIAMDAWANVSHYLDYKTEKDVPSDLRRDFYALSGLFYVADRHFEMFFLSRQASQEKMEEIFEDASEQLRLDQEINLDSLAAYLSSRFPDRRHGDAKNLSPLIEELSKFGFRTIGDVDRMLSSAENAFADYEKEYPPASTTGIFTDVGVTRISAQIVNPEFHRYSYFKGVKENEADPIWEAEVERYDRFRPQIKTLL